MEYHWTAFQQGILHSALFWGYITTQVLGGVLADLMNHKSVLLWGYALTVVGTILTPIVTKLFDWIGLFICRMGVGMAQGIFYNALHSITAHWIPTAERGMLGTLVFSGVHFGNSINFIVTGFIISHFHWSVVFYSYAAVSTVFGILFFFTTYADPSDFPGLKENEKEIFEEYSVHVAKLKENKQVPVKQIMLNIHVWAIVFAMIGQDWGFYTIVTLIPSYLKNVLHMDVEQNGIAVSSVYIVVFLIALVAGYLSDFVNKKKLLPLTWSRKIFYLIGSVIPAITFLAVSYAECDKTLALIFLIIGLSPLGFFYPSVKVNPMDLSPNYAGTIGSIGQMGGCTSGVIIPNVYGFLTPNSYKSEWRVLFWISFIIMGGTGFIFLLLASAEVQPFNDYKKEDAE